jgi:hypothetical protein
MKKFMNIFRTVQSAGGWSTGANPRLGVSRFGLSILAGRFSVLLDGLWV